jgi:hypothetical protein
MVGLIHQIMPFPVAHPAAILPLRRYCPRYLNLSALIVGSLSPDFGYLFGHLHADRFSHRFWAGSFGFCLPAGLLIVWIFHFMRDPVVQLLPARYRELFRPRNLEPGMLGFRPSAFFRPSDFGFRYWPWLALPVSVLIGAWTHDLLDSLTHPDGWLVEHISALRAPVFQLAGTSMPVCELLYAGFTFLGAFWVAACYLRWLGQATGAPALRRPAMGWSCALLFGAAILALATVGRGRHQLLGLIPLGIVTVAVTLGCVAGTIWLFAPRQRLEAS